MMRRRLATSIVSVCSSNVTAGASSRERAMKWSRTSECGHVERHSGRRAFRRALTCAAIAIGIGGSSSSVLASGYLTSLGQGVPVSSYMMNNSVPPGSSTGMTLFLTSAISNPDSCGAIDKVHIPSTVPNYNSLVAALVSAVAAGQSIGFWSSGCAILPFWAGTTSYPQVWTLWVVP
jgi:hypothetical protein